MNAFAWGQTDCIFTSFLALFVLFTIKRAPVAAASFFGVALTFKLQAMFLLPLLLYSILAKQMRVWHLLLVPMIYLLMMVPAAIAGRPWLELVTIHVAHVQRFSELAIHAPNLWRIVGGLELVDYRTGLLIGCAAAGLAGAAIAIRALRLQPGSRTIVLVAALSSALMPYLLPKMHDRYFFVADIMTLTVAFVIPRLWVTVPLFQVGSLLSYLPYFGLSGRASVYAVLPITFGVSVLALEYVRAQVGSNVSMREIFLRTGGRASARSPDAGDWEQPGRRAASPQLAAATFLLERSSKSVSTAARGTAAARPSDARLTAWIPRLPSRSSSGSAGSPLSGFPYCSCQSRALLLR